MKKILMLPVLALMGMVGTASAAENCLYASGDCWPRTGDPGCQAHGWIFEGGTEGAGTFCAGGTFTGEGRSTTPPTTSTVKGCCMWAETGSCNTMYTDQEVTDCNGGTNVNHGTAACPKDATNHDTCPGGVLPPPASQITPPPISQISPIILQPQGMTKVTGLTLAPHSLGMQISTQKDAKLSIFDARGNMVYKSDVVAGINVVNLQDQKQGVYFAVVASGSLKQSLRVIVK